MRLDSDIYESYEPSRNQQAEGRGSAENRSAVATAISEVPNAASVTVRLPPPPANPSLVKRTSSGLSRRDLSGPLRIIVRDRISVGVERATTEPFLVMTDPIDDGPLFNRRGVDARTHAVYSGPLKAGMDFGAANELSVSGLPGAGRASASPPAAEGAASDHGVSSERARLDAYVEQEAARLAHDDELRAAVSVLPRLYRGIASFADVSEWPSPVAGVGDSSAMLSWSGSTGHLEVEVTRGGTVEVFAFARDAASRRPVEPTDQAFAGDQLESAMQVAAERGQSVFEH